MGLPVLSSQRDNPQSSIEGGLRESRIHKVKVKTVDYMAVQETSVKREAQVDPRSTHTLTVKSLSIDPDAIIFC